MGNSYKIEASAEGYASKEIVVDVGFGSRAALIGAIANIVGVFAMPWNGELPDAIFVGLDPLSKPVSSFDEAVRRVADDIFSQTAEHAGTGGSPVRFVSEPVADTDTGEVFNVSPRIVSAIGEEARSKFPTFDVAELNSGNLAAASYVIVGIIPLEYFPELGHKLRHLSVSVLDPGTRVIVAHSEAWIADGGPTFELLPAYRDSPVYIRDEHVLAVASVARSARGALASRSFVDTLRTEALLVEADSAYDKGEYLRSLGFLTEASRHPDGYDMRIATARYRVLRKLGRIEDAVKALAEAVTLGMRSGKIDMTFLFNVDQVEFYDRADVEEYVLWLRVVGDVIVSLGRCVQVVGHASHSGTEPHNQELSERRANLIERRMEAAAPAVASRAKSIGKGFSENVIGTGANDDTDRVDRRVEFKLQNCGGA